MKQPWQKIFEKAPFPVLQDTAGWEELCFIEGKIKWKENDLYWSGHISGMLVKSKTYSMH